MRLASLAILVALIAAFVGEAAVAQQGPPPQGWVRQRITVIKPRSYLDAGTQVKPGTSWDQNYVRLLPGGNFPLYGPPNYGTNLRYPLPGPYEVPGLGY